MWLIGSSGLHSLFSSLHGLSELMCEKRCFGSVVWPCSSPAFLTSTELATDAGVPWISGITVEHEAKGKGTVGISQKPDQMVYFTRGNAKILLLAVENKSSTNQPEHLGRLPMLLSQAYKQQLVLWHDCLLRRELPPALHQIVVVGLETHGNSVCLCALTGFLAERNRAAPIRLLFQRGKAVDLAQPRNVLKVLLKLAIWSKHLCDVGKSLSEVRAGNIFNQLGEQLSNLPSSVGKNTESSASSVQERRGDIRGGATHALGTQLLSHPLFVASSIRVIYPPPRMVYLPSREGSASSSLSSSSADPYANRRSAVFSGVWLPTRSPCVIKAWLHEPDTVPSEKRRELRAVRHLANAQPPIAPHLLGEVDLGNVGSAVVMEQGVERVCPYTSDELLSAARQLVELVLALHETGVVHCDIKPAHVMRRADGSMMLIDFGNSGLVAEGESLASGARAQDCSLGTEGFEAPERRQWQREAPAASDAFSVGKTLLYWCDNAPGGDAVRAVGLSLSHEDMSKRLSLARAREVLHGLELTACG